MFASSHAPPLLITLLGRFGLRVSGRDVTTLPRKARALLAYLAMQDGRAVSREAMSDLLWTDRGAEQARHSLRQTLLVLRRELRGGAETVLQGDDRTLSFAPGMVESDVGQLRRLAGSAERADLAEAAGLYGGKLLAGFPTVAADFDDWLTQAREQVDTVTLDVLGRLADACAVAGDMLAAVTTSERMLAIDPLREDVHRRVMTAYWQAGRRADAIKQYNACVEVLKRELDVPPSVETETLVRRIRGEERSGAVVIPEVVRPTVYAQPSDGPPWIAVLPLRLQPGDDHGRWFADGVIEGIIHTLSGLENLSVISRGTSLGYADKDVDPRVVGRELGVRYVLTGSVRRTADQLRIHTELAEAGTGRVLRSDRHDGLVTDLFDVQDYIATRVAATIAPTVRDQELKRAMRKHPGSMTGYDFLLQGIDCLYSLRQERFDQARDLLQQARTHDPDFAPAYSYSATWHMLRIGQGWSAQVDDDARRAGEYAAAAIERDPNDAVALSLFGQMMSFTRREYKVALEFLDRAIEMGPSCHLAWTLSSTTNSWIGNGRRAVEHAQRAMQLSPLDPFAYFTEHMLSQGHYVSGDYHEAVAWAQRAYTHNPLLTSNLRTLTASLVAADDIPEARRFARQMLAIEPSFRLQNFTSRSPLSPQILGPYVERLRTAGLPD